MNPTFEDFAEPVYFGEDGDWIVIRGDIPEADAAQKMMDFEHHLIGEPSIFKGEVMTDRRQPLDFYTEGICAGVCYFDSNLNDLRLSTTGKTSDGQASVEVWFVYLQ